MGRRLSRKAELGSPGGMAAVILAGGMGTRLGDLSADRPKALVPVAGRPFADYQLRWLRSQGVDRVVYSIGHLGSQIREFVGSGERWDLHVDYVDDGDQLRGTGGALRLADEQGVLAPRFLILYGDSYLDLDLSELWRFHEAAGLPMTMAVFENAGRYDSSNVCFENGRLIRYDKARPNELLDRMRHIDYGVSVMDRDLVAQRIPSSEVVDLSAVQHQLSIEGRLAGFEVSERFYEVGTPTGLSELEDHLRREQDPERCHTSTPPK
jgi:NDP-sugar pyrophosphorylase family protein